MARKLNIRIATGKTLEEAASQLQGVLLHGEDGEVLLGSHVVLDGDKVSIVLIDSVMDSKVDP